MENGSGSVLQNTATCERDTGDRGPSGREWRPDQRRLRPAPRRIAAKRLTPTGGADRVGVRVLGAVGSPCRIAAATLRRRAVWQRRRHFRRERGTGERGLRRWRLGGICRIAAKRLTLTGGAYRVGGRMPGDVDVGPCRLAAATSPTSRRRAVWQRRRHFRRWTRHGRTWGHVGGMMASQSVRFHCLAKRQTLTTGRSFAAVFTCSGRRLD